ncbi:MAG: hypothetical protein QNK84_03680 [Flavobacteriales bacterium]
MRPINSKVIGLILTLLVSFFFIGYMLFLGDNVLDPGDGIKYFTIAFISVIILLLEKYGRFKSVSKNTLFIVPSLLLIYVLVRAFNVSFIIDEAMSYDILLNKPYYFKALIFDDSHFYIANNHVLNTLFGYISYYTLGDSPFAFRIFNVLAFVVYSYYSVKIIKLFSKSRMSAIIGLVFLFLNPFMLEFFSLYRGYGLSLACASGLIYNFSKYCFEEQELKFVVRGTAFSVLAIYANFALLIPVFIVQILCLVFINKSIKVTEILKRKETLIFILSAIFLIPAVSNILILSELKELYFGGDSSFVNDTLNSFVEYTLYSKNELDRIVLTVTIVLMVLYALFFSKSKELLYITFVIIGLAIFPTVLNFLLETKFVIERASLYVIPFFGIFFMVLYDNYLKQKWIKVVLSFMLIFLTVSAVKKSIKSYNINTTTTWRTDSNNKDVLIDVLELNNNNSFSLAVFWVFEDVTKYYAERYSLKQLQSIKRLGSNKPIEPGIDYYYVRKSDLNRVTFKYETVKEYMLSGTVIIKEK